MRFCLIFELFFIAVTRQPDGDDGRCIYSDSVYCLLINIQSNGFVLEVVQYTQHFFFKDCVKVVGKKRMNSVRVAYFMQFCLIMCNEN